jgi:hypothetical protein
LIHSVIYDGFILPADETGIERRRWGDWGARRQGDWGSGRQREEKTENTEIPALELTEEEKLIFKLLNEKSPVDLNELKARAGLSNKK